MEIFATIKNILRSQQSADMPITFNDLQFKVGRPNSNQLAWSDVEKITAYKIDLLTSDEIRVQFDHSNGSIVVTEKSQGFSKLMQEVVRRFPTAKDWHAKVSQPAFSSCETTLFNKQRT